MLNKDQALRDVILGILPHHYAGGIAKFNGLTVDKLKLLIDNNFIDMQGTQNYSPTTEDIYNFMCRHPEMMAHGYAVNLSRSDYRVTLEGVQGHTDSQGTINEFISIFRQADEFMFEDGHLYCWYD